MLGPMIVTLGAVAVGATLALVTVRGHVALGALRTFAAIAVVAAVLIQLLPEAVQELGASALLAFVGALLLPGLVAQIAHRMRGAEISARGVGADLGFYGFVVHQWAEGLALGTFMGGGHEAHDHGDLVLGMAAHTVPLTAVFVAATLASRGRRSALARTGILLLATALGFVAAGTIQESDIAGAIPWLSAFVAGLLCHILLHDEGLSVRRTPLAGLLDVLAAVAGVTLPWLAAGVHHHGVHGAHEDLRAQLGDAFVELVAETTPMLLLGLILGAGLQVLGSRIPARYFSTGGSVRQALRGIAIGAPRPLCACGVLPLAEALRKRGAGAALVMAFLLSIPELGPETLTLTIRFFGTPFALVRLGAALLVAFAAAVLFARITQRRSDATSPRATSEATAHATPETTMVTDGPATPRPRWSEAFGYFDELLLHTAPWTFVGLVAAAYVEAVIPSGSLAGLTKGGLDLLVIAAIAIPTYVCAASATPLAAVLLLKGISPGAVLVGMLLGPATNIATIGVLRRGYGRRAVVLMVLAIGALSIGLGALVNAIDIPVRLPHQLEQVHEHGTLAVMATVVLVLTLLRQLWRWGPHPWFEILDAGGYGHGHGHDHGHDHHDHDHDHHPDATRHYHAHDHDHLPGLPGLIDPQSSSRHAHAPRDLARDDVDSPRGG